MPLAWRFGPGQLRFLLAALVVVSHLSSLNIGRPAVLLFFMLSGYWVSRLLGGWQAGTPAFLASRALRVWPVYAIVTLAAWALLGLVGAERPATPWSALALLGLAARPGDVLGVSWSLDIELQFYAALPLIAWAWARLPAGWLLTGAMAAFAAGIALFTAGLPCVLFYLPVFLVGVAIHRRQWQPGPGLAAASLVAALLFGAVIIVVPGWTGLLFKASFADSTAENLGHMLWVLLLAPAVAWNVRQVSDRIDRWLGDLSYTLYLVHFPLTLLLATLVPITGGPAKLLALILIMIVSVAVFIGVDRPLEARRQRLWRRPNPA